MLLTIHPENPELRKIKQVVDVLAQGGLVIYPTDTVYGLGCDIYNQKAIERLCRLKGVKPDKMSFSFICNDLSPHLRIYAQPGHPHLQNHEEGTSRSLHFHPEGQ
jgi:tRNA A37 threonylcarbamoyladenosine synthetase subunit TsaC/SUA5/YrdC